MLKLKTFNLFFVKRRYLCGIILCLIYFLWKHRRSGGQINRKQSGATRLARFSGHWRETLRGSAPTSNAVVASFCINHSVFGVLACRPSCVCVERAALFLRIRGFEAQCKDLRMLQSLNYSWDKSRDCVILT